LAMAGLTHSLTLSEMLRPAGSLHPAPLLLLGAGLFVVLLAETCRVPVDDPNTHLELTMIHEVMVLDHSGPLLGAALYGASIKMLVLGNMVMNVLSPLTLAGGLMDWGLVVGRLLGLAAAIGVIESVMARLPMRHVPRLLVASGLLCMLGYLLSLGA
jgi:formate hydrogenlyase subunit 4